MMKPLTVARRKLAQLARLATDPFGRRQVSRQLDERSVWLWQVLNEQSEAIHRLVTEQAERTRTAVTGGDEWKQLELETLLRYLRKKEYLATIRAGELELPELHTDHPLAADSNDTLHPRGAKRDNSISLRFNQRLHQLFNYRRMNVLDLGCAGGGMVRTLIDDGHFAVGLEGSDYPRLNQTGEWGTIPHHLFTCDITKPFKLTNRATCEPLRFDAITAWEVLEHIPEDRIAALMTNIDQHLAPNGCVLCSVSTVRDYSPATGIDWHRTVKPRSWWESTMAKAGFITIHDHPFGPRDWLRGSGNVRDDTRPEDGKGFQIALRRGSEAGGRA